MRPLFLLGVFLLPGLGTPLRARQNAKRPTTPTIGKPAPEIVGRDLSGKSFKLSDYRGKVVVLDFWGNW